MKKWFAWTLLSLGLAATAHAQNLPDFTTLAEKHSPSVVNITTTQEARGRARGQMPHPEEMFDFFRRFVPPEGE